MLSFLGHTKIWQNLIGRLTQGKLPSALLCLGPEGIGKSLVAQTLAQLLLCHSPQNNGPCGHCPACQKFKLHQHPDFFTAEREGQFIKIDTIRQWMPHLKFSPYEGKARIFFLPDAHAMNLSAANALLKILEEPPAHHYFILTTHATHRLPMTILSRCQKIYFSPLTAETIEQILSQNTSNEPLPKFPKSWLSLGSPGLILSWLANTKFLQHPVWKDFFNNPETIKWKDLVGFCTLFKTCEHPQSFYQWLLFNLSQILKERPTFALMDFSEKITRVQRLANVNLNSMLTMEYLLSSMKYE